jgi:acetoin utilization deacetylase AcuC-like enzyme
LKTDRDIGMYFIYDDYYLKHENGISHPENPERLKYIKRAADSLEERGLIEYINPRPAGKKQIEMVHDISYINRVEELSAGGGLSFLDMDTGVSRHTYSCALLAAGGCLDGLDLIFSENSKYKKFFLACRPPGHHAFPAGGSGFCIFNNAALGARYALEHFGLKRIAIVDFDAHHGNGTQDIFYEDSGVFYISFHQYPHYPGTGGADERGSGKGKGFNLNLPFAPGTGEPDYLAALIDIVIPLLDEYRPELVIVSAGYDSHVSDSMSSLELVEDSYLRIMAALSLISRKYCRERMAIVLEGGYEYRSTADSTVSTIMGCLEDNSFKSTDDLEKYFGIDDSRKNRVKNRTMLDQTAKDLGLIQ